MKFITVTDVKDGQRRAIRADMILQMNSGESDDGEAITFILLDKLGWSRPVRETVGEVQQLIANAPDL